MKAEINAEGILKVEAETELESYALKRWLKENPALINTPDAMKNLLFDVRA